MYAALVRTAPSNKATACWSWIISSTSSSTVLPAEGRLEGGDEKEKPGVAEVEGIVKPAEDDD
jgi:hypothetical protein